jgi:hypothetical protein
MKTKIKYFLLVGCTLFGFLSVLLSFHYSESIIHGNNPFIRRYVQGCVSMHEINLGYNSYYFAGLSGERIFLGNSTAPLHIASVDSALTKKESLTMQLDEHGFRFMSPVTRVVFPNLYLIDGTVPAVYKGTVTSGKLKLRWQGKHLFSQPQLVDSVSMICRTIDPGTQSSELATLNFKNAMSFKIHDDLLDKQVDGIFDSDGVLHYDSQSKKAIYTYFYRNQFVVADHNLKLDYKGTTIDTTRKAKIEVAYVKSRDEKKLSRPPIVVNKMSAVDGNLLYINSGLIGQFEDRSLWKQSSIIDVYDIASQRYIASFYVYDIDGKRARAIAAENGRFYALIGTRMVYYRLDKLIMQHYKKY